MLFRFSLFPFLFPFLDYHTIIPKPKTPTPAPEMYQL